MNFFEEQRRKLELSPTQMGARVDASAATVRLWETEKFVPSVPVSTLAIGYGVSESRMEKELMALRRRIEARKAELTAAK